MHIKYWYVYRKVIFYSYTICMDTHSFLTCIESSLHNRFTDSSRAVWSRSEDDLNLVEGQSLVARHYLNDAKGKEQQAQQLFNCCLLTGVCELNVLKFNLSHGHDFIMSLFLTWLVRRIICWLVLCSYSQWELKWNTVIYLGLIISKLCCAGYIDCKDKMDIATVTKPTGLWN